MVYKGEIIVAMDPDLRDMYFCEVVRGDEENQRNLLCRVLSMVQYPIQHAVMDGSVPNDNPPLGEGQRAMLKFVRRVDTPDKHQHNYEDSVSRCLERYAQTRSALRRQLESVPEAIRRAAMPSEEEFAILDRHRARDYRRRRTIINH